MALYLFNDRDVWLFERETWSISRFFIQTLSLSHPRLPLYLTAKILLFILLAYFLRKFTERYLLYLLSINSKWWKVANSAFECRLVLNCARMGRPENYLQKLMIESPNPPESGQKRKSIVFWPIYLQKLHWFAFVSELPNPPEMGETCAFVLSKFL